MRERSHQTHHAASNNISSSSGLSGLRSLSNLAMVYWIGGSLTLATLVIPVLFRVLDIVTAAIITGQLLKISSYIGVFALLFAIICCLWQWRWQAVKRIELWYLLLMEILVVLNSFAIFGKLALLRQTLAGLANRLVIIHPSFNFWHSWYAIVFIMINILGLLYILNKSSR